MVTDRSYLSNPVFTAGMSVLHAETDAPNDHSDFDLAELGITVGAKLVLSP